MGEITRIQCCGQLPHNFCIQMGKFKYPKEFACKCGCGFSAIDFNVWLVNQKVRDYFGVAVIVVSGCRCKNHNTITGGSPDSDHLISCADDFAVKGVSSNAVAEFLETVPEVKRIGIYDPGDKYGEDGFCHSGVRDRGIGTWRRWHYNSQGILISSVALA